MSNKLILPISIILGCLILGGFYYLGQLEKEQSIKEEIELQKKINKLETNSRISERKSECKEKAKDYAKKQEEHDAITDSQVRRVVYDTKKDSCFADIQLFTMNSPINDYEYHLIDPESWKVISVCWYNVAKEKSRHCSEYKRYYSDFFEGKANLKEAYFD